MATLLERFPAQDSVMSSRFLSEEQISEIDSLCRGRHFSGIASLYWKMRKELAIALGGVVNHDDPRKIFLQKFLGFGEKETHQFWFEDLFKEALAEVRFFVSVISSPFVSRKNDPKESDTFSLMLFYTALKKIDSHYQLYLASRP